MSVLSDEALRSNRAGPVGGCEGKKSFEIFTLANKVANRANRNGAGAKRYSAYRCGACSLFHVGNRPQVVKQRRVNLAKRRAAARESTE